MIIHQQRRGTDFFKEIERLLAPSYIQERFSSGHILWNEGDPASRMISIIKGKAKIFRLLEDGKQVPLFIFGPDDTFGFLPLIDGSPYPASAEIMEDTQAWVMTREKLHAAIRQDPDVAIFLLGQLGRRLRGAFDQIERLSTRGILPRMASALVSLSATSGKSENLEIISLPVSSREYAAFIGLTPESFSRGITRLVDAGVLQRLGGNSFRVLDPERLHAESRSET